MISRRITFAGDAAQIAGELLLPAGPGPYPAVVLLHGALGGERNSNRAIAQRFVEAGIASLIFDRRGEGESTGSLGQDLTKYSNDAMAAYRALQSEPDIAAERVGIWGYSNGAWVASLAASQLPDVAFLLLTGAAGVSPARAEVYRRTADLRAQGISPATLALVEEAWTISFDYLTDGVWRPGWDERIGELRARLAADTSLASLPVSELVKAHPELNSLPHLEMLAPDRRGPLAGRTPSMGYDPVPALLQVRCPTLVVLAENDANVPFAESIARFRTVAETRLDGEFRIEVIPGASHLFTRKGSPGELLTGGAPQPFAREDYLADYLELMVNWLAANS